MVLIYNVPLWKKFTGPRVSLAYFYWLCTIVARIFLPFFLAYASAGFWKTSEVYREQPNIQFTHDILLLVEGNQPGTQLLYSTLPQFTDIVGSNRVRAPTVQSTELDRDNNGLSDEISFDIRLPLLDTEAVYRVAAMLFFSAKLKERVRLEMSGLAYIYYEAPVAGTQLDVGGDLLFHQINPISLNGARLVYSDPILDPTKVTTVQDLLFPTILDGYRRRNETLFFDYKTPFWTSGADQEFHLNINMRVPVQPVMYVPGFSEVTKFAWVQYVAILWALSYLIMWISDFVFEHQIVDTRVQRDADPPARIHAY